MDPLVSSQVLVERARKQDGDAIAALYQRYRDKLRIALRRRLGKRYRRALLDSEDAVQDGILAALNGISTFQYREPGSFLAWLLRVAEREVLQRIRAHGAAMRDKDREVPLDEAAAAPALDATPSEVARGRELEDRIQRCLETLADHEREVIVLRRYLDLSTEEIREDMRLATTGAVRALLSRAQTKLAQCLEEQA